MAFSKAWIFYPEASTRAANAALGLDIDSGGFGWGKGQAEKACLISLCEMNDRIAASSFLYGALNIAFRTAMNGLCTPGKNSPTSTILWSRDYAFTNTLGGATREATSSFSNRSVGASPLDHPTARSDKAWSARVAR